MAYNLIPPANDAPPGTQPTLRAITERIYQLERDRESDLTAQNATDKGQAATLGAISAQVSDLLGRNGYVSSSGASNSWSVTSAANLSLGPPVVVTVDRPRVIMAEFTVQGEVGGVAYNGQAFSISTRTTVALNGGYTYYTGGSDGYLGAYGSWNVTTGFNSNTIYGTTTAKYIYTVPAGTYSFQGLIAERTVSNSGGASASGSVRNPSLIVSVLQGA